MYNDPNFSLLISSTDEEENNFKIVESFENNFG